MENFDKNYNIIKKSLLDLNIESSFKTKKIDKFSIFYSNNLSKIKSDKISYLKIKKYAIILLGNRLSESNHSKWLVFYIIKVLKLKPIIIYIDDKHSEIIKTIVDGIYSKDDYLIYSLYPNDLKVFESFINKETKQLDWDMKFLEISESLSKMSKCISKKVCALAVHDNRIIATGLNGSAPNADNCCDVFPEGLTDREKHHDWSLKNEIHAEVNLICEVARNNGRPLKDCTIYINLQPCDTCTLYLLSIGIKRVVYSRLYDKSNRSKSFELFDKAGIEHDFIDMYSS